MYIGEKIKKVRHLKGLTQEQVALKLCISKQAYGKIERNQTKVDVERLYQLYDILEIPSVFINTKTEIQNYTSIIINSNPNTIETTPINTILNYIISYQNSEIAFLKNQIHLLNKYISSY